ncbi:putative transcription factor C2H2 family [Helianthus annuus]|nr:putative transcription factor C2H2 family [Helianthus annuus]KAJ0870013.1 putative transcription factor C2H2 family [Helianthus annuus]
MDEGNGKPTRLVLRCADDYGRFRCYLCHTYVTSAYTLYRHMRRHTLSDWRNTLPEKLECSTTIVVRHKLPNPILFDSDSDDEDSLDGEEECLTRRCNGRAVDLMEVLPAWNVTGRVKNKRGRSDAKNVEVLLPPKKKLKVADEVVSDVIKNDEAVLEAEGLKGNLKNDEVVTEVVKSKLVDIGGGKVVLDVDLNEDPVSEDPVVFDVDLNEESIRRN